ncbi:MAG: amidase [Acidobacteriales bacterium]|nr:amidase [Terriglobales bacterium]
MDPDALPTLSASQMANSVRQREVSALELTEAHLARIDQLQPTVNAFACVDRDGAREQARRADEALREGREVGALHGVPISIKSSISVKSLLCEAGSPLMRGNIAHEDAVCVARLRAAGAIILGTTNLPEMLMAYESDNDLYGRVNHPDHPDRTPGGSSGGEAAAVASGMSAAGVGSDSGGSVRVPAHYSGICALKATPGRIPGTGHDPQCLGPFSLLGCVGPMTRTVGDLRLMLQVMGGADDGDVMADPVPLDLSPCKRKLRIGYMEQHASAPVTADTRRAVQLASECLRKAGHEVFEFSLSGLEAVRDVWWTFFVKAGEALLRKAYLGHEHEMSWILRDFMQTAARTAPLHSDALLDAWVQRDLLRARMMREFREVDVWLTPVCSIPAFRHREREWTIEGCRVEYLDAMSYTQWFNVLGNPCTVVPTTRTAEGLPVGVQVVGRPWEEGLVLEVAEQMEAQLIKNRPGAIR